MRPWATQLLHPLPLGAAGVLALNDHVLKGAGVLPGWLTGKLSDFAGLFVFPIVLFVAVDAASGRRASSERWRRSSVYAAALLTALAFAAIKTSAPVSELASRFIGPMLLDPTDLIALPSTLFAALWLLRRERLPESACVRVRALVAFVLVGAACVATSPPRLVRDYPAWELQWLGARRLDCVNLDAWVSKSGKQGFGLTLELTPTSPCRVGVASARFSAAAVQVQAARLPPARTLTAREHVYLPFAFDNEALWNSGQHAGQLELVLDVGDRRERLVLELKHVFHGYHRNRFMDRPPDASTGFAEPPP